MKLPFDGAERRRIYLMRHGDVAYFDAQGQRVSDSRLVVLTAQGRSEALAMRDALSSVPFDKAISSGLPRTVETGAIVLGGRTIPLESWPQLEEIRGGTPDQRAAMQPADYAYAMFSAGSQDPEAAYARGERFRDFYARVTGAWTEILKTRHWSSLLIAAHGGVNRAILAYATGAGQAAFGAFEQDTGCLNVIDVDVDANGRVLRQIVRAMNVTPEDPAKLTRPLTAMEKLALQAFPHLKSPV
jgi:broad specificity phosphatase PhoE